MSSKPSVRPMNDPIPSPPVVGTMMQLARWRQGGGPTQRDRSAAPRRRRGLPAERIAAIEALCRRRMTSPAIAAELGLLVSTVGQVLRWLGLNRLEGFIDGIRK